MGYEGHQSQTQGQGQYFSIHEFCHGVDRILPEGLSEEEGRSIHDQLFSQVVAQEWSDDGDDGRKQPSTEAEESDQSVEFPLPEEIDEQEWSEASLFLYVSLEKLGYNSNEWGGLQMFRDRIVQHLLPTPTGDPEYHYVLDFGGGIGVKRVPRSWCHERQLLTSPTHEILVTRGGESSQSDHIFPAPKWWCGFSDESADNEDWEGRYVDFVDLGDTEDDSDGEQLEAWRLRGEIGAYDDGEDVSPWEFAKLYDDSQWESPYTTLLASREFTGAPPGTIDPPCPGPCVSLWDFFIMYWPDHILDRICRNSNIHANLIDLDVGDGETTNGRSRWKDITRNELKAWFGITVFMGLKRLLQIRDYWQGAQFFGCNLIKNSMSRVRFEDINRCIHLVNNVEIVTDRQDPRYDRVAKTRWLIKHFVTTSEELYNPDKHLCIDEIMVAYKGKYCQIRQYMRAKPVKYGIKIWCVCSSKSRYVWNINVYLGKDGEKSVIGTGHDVVLALIQGLEHRRYVCMMDNYFSGVQLFDTLLKHGFYAIGTICVDRVGLPSSMEGHTKSEKVQYGTLFWNMHRSRRMAAICWYDNRPLYLLSIHFDPVGPETVYCKRWVKRSREEFPTSPIQLEY